MEQGSGLSRSSHVTDHSRPWERSLEAQPYCGERVHTITCLACSSVAPAQPYCGERVHTITCLACPTLAPDPSSALLWRESPHHHVPCLLHSGSRSKLSLYCGERAHNITCLACSTEAPGPTSLWTIVLFGDVEKSALEVQTYSLNHDILR